jgi:uncharacterized membrane protein YdjX (TVP38/TMEM64 family)
MTDDLKGIGYNATMADNTATSTSAPRTGKPLRRAVYLRLAFIISAALGLNLLVLMVPVTWIDGLRSWGPLAYLAAFGVTALANASVIVPLPYPGIIARMAGVLGDSVGVALVGAAGSTLGESTAFLVGRAGKLVVEDTRFYRWLRQQLHTPVRAFIVLLALSAPPNPFFDVAGITAGTLGVPYWIFFLATFLGRIIKMLIFVGLGQQLL